MHLMMINASPRVSSQSNTEIILHRFADGFLESGEHVASFYPLEKQSSWRKIREALYQETFILFALPMYVESIPGIMMAFLETLEIAKMQGKTFYFILQGGFAEASQFRCCEAYLKKLPDYFGCTYGGTLLKGNMFILHELNVNKQMHEVSGFYKMGKAFAKQPYFDETVVNEFAKPEYLSTPMKLFMTVINPIQRKIFRIFAKRKGCKTRLDARPYEEKNIK